MLVDKSEQLLPNAPTENAQNLVERVLAEFWSTKDSCEKVLVKFKNKGWGSELKLLRMEEYLESNTNWALLWLRAWLYSSHMETGCGIQQY